MTNDAPDGQLTETAAPRGPVQRRPADQPIVAVLVAGLLLAVCLTLTYWRGLHAPFIYDDHDAIIANESLSGGMLDTLHPPDQSPVTSRPLVNLSFALLHPGDPRSEPMPHHVVNLTLHWLAAITLFALVSQLLRSPRAPASLTPCTTPIAFGSALIWAVHPLQTETVQYITQRTELMFGLFCLATIWAAACGMANSGGRKAIWFVAAILLCAAGMASKEVMVVTPLLVLLVDRTFYSGAFLKALRTHAPLYVGLAATWALLTYLVLTGSRSESVGAMHEVSRVDYLLTQSAVIVHYIRLFIWPDALSISSGWRIVDSITEVWWQFTVMAVLGVLTIISLWKWPMIGLIGAWFFLVLAPTSSILPILTEVAAERRMYVPSAALCGAVMVAIALMLQRRMHKRHTMLSVTCAGLILAAPLLCRSVARIADYESVESIWRSAVEVSSTDDVARVGLAWELMSQRRQRDAIAPLREAVELRPDNARAHRLLGMCLFDTGDRAAGLEHLLQAVRLQPNNPLARGIAVDASRIVGHTQLAEFLAEGGVP